MKPTLGSIFSLGMFAIAPLFAQTPVQEPFAQQAPPARQHRPVVLSIGGEVITASPVKGRALGWWLRSPHCHVTIAARLGNGGGEASGVAYLMRAIGPGTSPDDEIAQTPFELPYPFDGWIPLFTNLDLPMGEYWLVIAKPRDKTFSSINWILANPMLLNASSAIRYIGTTSYTYDSDVADYIPASKFGPKYEPYGFEVEIVGEEVPIGDAR